MKTITLSDGNTYKLGIRHGTTEFPRISSPIERFNYYVSREYPSRRCTEVFLKSQEDKVVFEAKAICATGDNFSKQQGRKQAAIKLIKESIFTKEDRRKIFYAICPEYQPNMVSP